MHLFHKLQRRAAVPAMVALLAVGLGACATSDAAAPEAAAEQVANTVVVDDMSYAPETLTVPVGTTVTWEFQDAGIGHDVVGDDFQSEIMTEGTFSHTFDEPGTYEYLCSLHPTMVGKIEVTQ